MSFFAKFFKSKPGRTQMMTTKVSLKELAAAGTDQKKDDVEEEHEEDSTSSSDPSKNSDINLPSNGRNKTDRMSVSRSGRFRQKQRRRSGLFDSSIVSIDKDDAHNTSKDLDRDHHHQNNNSSSTSSKVSGSHHGSDIVQVVNSDLKLQTVT